MISYRKTPKYFREIQMRSTKIDNCLKEANVFKTSLTTLINIHVAATRTRVNSKILPLA